MKKQGTREQANKGTGAESSDQGSEINPPAFERPSIVRRFGGPALILLCAAVALLPQMRRGASCGHDFDFHLVSWLDALNSWRQGIFYPRWTPSPNFGAGEPRFIFYPPLTWMLGAVMGSLMPWRFVPMAMNWLLLAATGLATRALAREAIEDGPATLAGCAAIFSGYPLFTAYERSDFAELAGGLWIPLILLLILHDGPHRTLQLRKHLLSSSPGPGKPDSSSAAKINARGALDRRALLLALVVAGAWLSNAPVGVMASYLLTAMAVMLALITKSWVPILRAAAASALGLGLAAIYLVPAAWEQRWVAIGRAINEPGSQIESSWLFARHAGPQLALHDAVLHRISLIVAVMIAITLAGVAVSWKRGRLPGRFHWWLPLAAIPLLVLFLQLPVSLPVWNLLPKLRFLQFPWRWLVSLEAPLGFFFASAVWTNRRRWRPVVLILCAGLFLANTAAAGRWLFSPCDEQDNVASMLDQYRARAILNDSDEYAPPNSDDSLIPVDLPDACLNGDPAVTLGKIRDEDGMLAWDPSQQSCAATYSAEARRGEPGIEHRHIAATIGKPGYLILRLRTYPAWRVRVNGRIVSAMPTRDDGLMAVPVPQGRVDLSVDWTTTPDVLTGRIISLMTLALVTVLWWLDQRRVRSQLS